MSVFSDAVWEFRRALLLRTLRQHRGKVGAAGAALGLHRNTMSRLIAASSISVPGVRAEFRKEAKRRADLRAVELERDPPVSTADLCAVKARFCSGFPLPAELRAAQAERDPPITQAEHERLEGPKRGSYARKKPPARIDALAMSERLWIAAGRIRK